MIETCWFCDKGFSPGEEPLRMILGWEKLRTRQGGANMVHLRERIGQLAHDSCIQAQKGKQVPTEEAVKLDVTTRYRAQVKRA